MGYDLSTANFNDDDISAFKRDMPEVVCRYFFCELRILVIGKEGLPRTTKEEEAKTLEIKAIG